MFALLENLLKNLNAEQDQFLEIKNISDAQLFDFYIQQGFKNNNLLVVLEELIINSREHAKSSADFLFRKKDDDFIFIVRDRGLGIHQTVPKNIHLSDIAGKTSSSILRLALEESISCTGELGRGMGLYYLSRFISESQSQGLIASDSGFVCKIAEVYTEKQIEADLQQNIIIIKMTAKELGL